MHMQALIERKDRCFAHIRRPIHSFDLAVRDGRYHLNVISVLTAPPGS